MHPFVRVHTCDVRLHEPIDSDREPLPIDTTYLHTLVYADLRIVGLMAYQEDSGIVTRLDTITAGRMRDSYISPGRELAHVSWKGTTSSVVDKRIWVDTADYQSPKGKYTNGEEDVRFVGKVSSSMANLDTVSYSDHYSDYMNHRPFVVYRDHQTRLRSGSMVRQNQSADSLTCSASGANLR